MFQAYEVTDPWGDTCSTGAASSQTLGLARLQPSGPATSRARPTTASSCACASTPTSASTPTCRRSQAGGETNYHTPAGDGIRFIPGLEEAPVDIDVRLRRGAQSRRRSARLQARSAVRDRRARLVVVRRRPGTAHDAVLRPASRCTAASSSAADCPLSTSRFEQQGVWRGSHSDFGNGDGQPVGHRLSLVSIRGAGARVRLRAREQRSVLCARPRSHTAASTTRESRSRSSSRIPPRARHPRGRLQNRLPARASRRIGSAALPTSQVADYRRRQGRHRLRPLQRRRLALVRRRSRRTWASTSRSAPTSSTSCRPSTRDSIWNWFTHSPL